MYDTIVFATTADDYAAVIFRDEAPTAEEGIAQITRYAEATGGQVTFDSESQELAGHLIRGYLTTGGIIQPFLVGSV